jgi:regulator of sigma E protease
VPRDSPAYAAGLRTFDRVVRVDGTAVDTEVDFFHAVAKAAGPTVTLDAVRSDPMDVPAGQLLAPSVVTVQVPKQQGEAYAALGVESAALYVGTVIPGTAAERAGLRRGDRLLQLDGKPLESWTVLVLALKERQDKPIELTWRAGDEVKTQTLSQAPLGSRDEVGTKVESLDLGIRSWTTRFEERSPDLVTLHMGPMEAIMASLRRVPEVTAKTAIVIGSMLTGRVSMDNMGSILMIHDLAARSAEAGPSAYLELMAIISINLGLMNLLPIPILDGFHLLAALWEGVRRRPIPVRAREIANMVGLAMLLFLMGIAIKNDIVRMW